MLSAVPTGLSIPASLPTDKSVDYFHLSLRDKIHICKNVGMHPTVIIYYFLPNGKGKMDDDNRLTGYIPAVGPIMINPVLRKIKTCRDALAGRLYG